LVRTDPSDIGSTSLALVTTAVLPIGANGRFGNIWATGFTGNGAWRTPQIISTSPAPTEYPAVAIGPGGTATAMWLQGATVSTRTIVAAHYR